MIGHEYHGNRHPLHDRIESLKRDNAQSRELLLNQASYIKTLQEENLRLNKDSAAKSFFISEQEALISALLATQTELVEVLAEAKTYCEGPQWSPSMCDDIAKALEKVGK